MTKPQKMRTLSIKISQPEIEKLNYERFAYRHAMIQRRLHAVYLKAALDYSNQTITAITSLHYNIVAYWIQVYREKGYDGLLSNHYGTNKSELENHRESILLSLSEQAAQKGQVHLFFCDAAYFVLQPFLCFLWSAVRVFIRASAVRNRINVLGAVNAITKEVITFTNTTYITSDTLIKFLKQLKEKFSDKPIAIILDNANCG